MGLNPIRHRILEGLSQITQQPLKNIRPLLMIPKNIEHGQYSISLPTLSKQTNYTEDKIEQLLSLKVQSYEGQLNRIGPFLNFNFNKSLLIKMILENIINNPKQENYLYLEDNQYDNSTVIVEFSSPNIAKPFHIGHLRSSIIGQYISNLIKFNHPTANVINVNYLGDWGKQYGVLVLGYEMFGDKEELKKDAMLHLYNVYVKIHQVIEQDKQLLEKAQHYFKLLEEGDEKMIQQWKWFYELSIKSFKQMYELMNIKFDIYSGESESNEYIPLVKQSLINSGLLITGKEGELYIDLKQYDLGQPILFKKDNTTLYLTRDLATIIKRQIEFKFNKMIYVVGNEQSLHLKQLFKIIQLIHQNIEQQVSLKYNITFQNNWYTQLQHVGFGRIMGISTRKGNTVFLKQIIEKCQSRILDIMQQNNDLNQHEMLAISNDISLAAIKIQDFISRRNLDYKFDWNRMLDYKGFTGVYLLYSYAKICGIERKSNIKLEGAIDYSLLIEPIAFELSHQLAQVNDKLQLSLTNFEPCTITQYLLNVANLSIKANEQLRVKDLNNLELSKARLALFIATKKVLEKGLYVLGLKPVEKM